MVLCVTSVCSDYTNHTPEKYKNINIKSGPDPFEIIVVLESAYKPYIMYHHFVYNFKYQIKSIEIRAEKKLEIYVFCVMFVRC